MIKLYSRKPVIFLKLINGCTIGLRKHQLHCVYHTMGVNHHIINADGFVLFSLPLKSCCLYSWVVFWYILCFLVLVYLYIVKVYLSMLTVVKICRIYAALYVGHVIAQIKKMKRHTHSIRAFWPICLQAI